MKRKLVALMALLASLSLAQTPPNTDSHTITVKVPPVLRLSLDATEYLFDFTVGTSVANNSLGFPKATKAAYEAFLDDESKTKLIFAPTSITFADTSISNDYGTLRINTNQAQWVVKIHSITGNLEAPLSNNRLKVHAVQVVGSKGSSLTSMPGLTGTPGGTNLAAGTNIIQATSDGQGRSVYKLYYLLEMDINDAFPSDSVYSSTINVVLLLTTP
jgi:hypothetical protein